MQCILSWAPIQKIYGLGNDRLYVRDVDTGEIAETYVTKPTRGTHC